ncbi:hypothetical protein BLAT2472_30220 [Burkholderia latens]
MHAILTDAHASEWPKVACRRVATHRHPVAELSRRRHKDEAKCRLSRIAEHLMDYKSIVRSGLCAYIAGPRDSLRNIKRGFPESGVREKETCTTTTPPTRVAIATQPQQASRGVNGCRAHWR